MSEETTSPCFASRLRLLRKRKKIRQVDLALEFGLAQTTIANYEQNKRFPDEEILKKIADYFGVSLDFLLGVTDIEHPIMQLPADENTYSIGATSLSPLAENYLQALLRGDKRGATDLILQTARQGADVKTIYLEVLEPSLVKLGHLWEINEVDVSTEHYCSEITQAIMSQLSSFLHHSKAPRGTVVTLAVGGELHEIGIRMVADLLEDAGWYSYHLGVNVPTASVDRALSDINANALAISVTMPLYIDAAANLIGHVRRAMSEERVPPMRIIVGGQAFRMSGGLWRSVGADGSASDAAKAVGLLESLVHGNTMP